MKRIVGKSPSSESKFSKPPQQMTPKKKPEWNDNLNDPSRFQISQEDLLRKKRLLVSKHNVLSPDYKPPKLHSIVRKKSASKKLVMREDHFESEYPEDRADSEDEGASKHRSRDAEMTSLDLLDSDQEDDPTRDQQPNTRFKQRNMRSQANKSPSLSKRSPRSPYQQRLSSLQTFEDGNFTKSVSPKKTAQVETIVTKSKETEERLCDSDLRMMAQDIDQLQRELRMYEELAGKRSILDAEELQTILSPQNDNDDENVDIMDRLSQKTVMRYLVNLVCQTMTHLLASEVKQQNLESAVELLKVQMAQILEVNSNPHPFAASQTLRHHAVSTAVMPTSSAHAPVPMSTIEDPQLSSNPPVFRGTSASDLLFMSEPPDFASPKVRNAIAKSDRNQPDVGATQPIMETAYETPVPAFEFQLSPETAADLAARTFDLYSSAHQQPPKPEKPHRETRDSASIPFGMKPSSQGDEELAYEWESQYEREYESYDAMIDRMSHRFTTQLKPTISSQHNPMESEAPSMVQVPNHGDQLPQPVKPSLHPKQQMLQGTRQVFTPQERIDARALFPPSPPSNSFASSSKKIYDASLGNYSLVDFN